MTIYQEFTDPKDPAVILSRKHMAQRIFRKVKKAWMRKSY
uniref:Uncharacterized protein n=1 Tax=viral metagenome TaxID=1070528 RepID=A0A6M3INA0_9ZZZZ